MYQRTLIANSKVDIKLIEIKIKTVELNGVISKICKSQQSKIILCSHKHDITPKRKKFYNSYWNQHTCSFNRQINLDSRMLQTRIKSCKKRTH